MVKTRSGREIKKPHVPYESDSADVTPPAHGAYSEPMEIDDENPRPVRVLRSNRRSHASAAAARPSEAIAGPLTDTHTHRTRGRKRKQPEEEKEEEEEAPAPSLSHRPASRASRGAARRAPAAPAPAAVPLNKRRRVVYRGRVQVPIEPVNWLAEVPEQVSNLILSRCGDGEFEAIINAAPSLSLACLSGFPLNKLLKINSEHNRKLMWQLQWICKRREAEVTQLMSERVGLVDLQCTGPELRTLTPFHPVIEVFELLQPENAVNYDLTPLRNLRSLKSLKLNGASFISDLGPLARCDKLQILQLNELPRIEDEALDHVAKLRSLRHLCLGSCSALTPDYVRRLEPIKGQLQYLYMAGTRVSDASLRQVVSLFPSLKWLSLEGVDHCSDEGFRCLGELEQLELLEMSSMRQLTDASLPTLLSLKRLKKLECCHNQVSVEGFLAAGIQKLEGLESLDVSGCDLMGPEEIKALVTALPRVEVEHSRFIQINLGGLQDGAATGPLGGLLQFLLLAHLGLFLDIDDHEDSD